MDVGRTTPVRAISAPASLFNSELLPTPVPPNNPTTSGLSSVLNRSTGLLVSIKLSADGNQPAAESAVVSCSDSLKRALASFSDITGLKLRSHPLQFILRYIFITRDVLS